MALALAYPASNAPSAGLFMASAACASPPRRRGAPVNVTETRPPLDLATVFRENAPFAWRALRRLGVPERDVEDVCQEVFVIVHRRLADFEGRSSVRTWIYGICARVASDYRRSGRVRREIVTDAPPEASGGAAQHEALAMKQAREALDRILDTLDEDKRAVFVLYEIEQLPMAEVAEALGCPLQTAYSRLHAARKIVEQGVAAAAEGGGR